MGYVLFVLSFLFLADLSLGEVTRGSFFHRGSVGFPAGIQEERMCSGDMQMFADLSGGKSPQSQETCDMALNHDFAELLKKQIPKCAAVASNQVFGSASTIPVKVHHIGGYANRKANTPGGSDKMSLHSRGMALDISGLTVEINGRPQFISFTQKSNNQPFYDSFRSCWDQAFRDNSRCSTCSIGHPHTHKPSNQLHCDHMHISFSCGKIPGVVSC